MLKSWLDPSPAEPPCMRTQASRVNTPSSVPLNCERTALMCASPLDMAFFPCQRPSVHSGNVWNSGEFHIHHRRSRERP